MKHQLRTILYIFGILLMVEAAFMLLCVPVSYLYGGADAIAFIISTVITACVGALCWASFRKKRGALNKRVAFLIVSLAWIIASCFGTLPFLLSGILTTFTDAFFESMSGFTAIGASVIVDVEAAPAGILLWRALTQWIGGMGIVVIVIAFVPFLGISGMSLFSAEISGPSKNKLHPHILVSTRRLWITYLALTIFAFILFMLAKDLEFIEVLCYTFSASSTGGFSIKADGVASCSPYVQYVIALIILISGINFSLNYFLMTGRFKKFFKDEELRMYLIVILIAAVVIISMLFFGTTYTFEEAFRHGLFYAVSLLSTSGFVSADYTAWPTYISFVFLILMFSGGMAGSTAGGMKIIRWIVLFKNCKYVLTNIVHSRALLPVRINGKSISENAISNIMAFFLLYIGVLGVGAVVLIALGVNVLESLGTSITMLCSFGPGLGASGGFGSYVHFPDAAKWVTSFLMLVGRLELMTVLILFFPPYWKK